MEAGSRIYVAGGQTFIGRALCRRLETQGHTVGCEEIDLGDPRAVLEAFARLRPEYVFVAAGRTAGIAGNQRRPAELMTDNLLVTANLLAAAHAHRVTKLLYLASSCTYPKLAPQPLHVSSLWSGPLEPSSAAYATAKLAGMTLCQAYRAQYGSRFITGIGADAYGPGDDFSREDSHVVPALIRRVHEAREDGLETVTVWGSGVPRREFIYVDDLADACIFAMERWEGVSPLNLGTGRQTSIAELADQVCAVVGYRGRPRFDPTKPDGMPFKGLDSTELCGMGWTPRWTLRAGLEQTYEWFRTEWVGNAAAR